MYQLKVMRFNKLLTLFIFFILFYSSLAANSVSGQYDMPLNSVKFEKQEIFSIFPIGWSKNGNSAFLIYKKTQKPSAWLITFDAIEDKVLWISDKYEINETNSILTIWNDQVDLFSDKLSEANIIPDLNPQFGGLSFTMMQDDYSIFSEELRQAGQQGITSLSLKIVSKKRGEKSLYEYTQSDKQDLVLIDFQVLGYFKSPWEDRIAVVSAEDSHREKENNILTLRFSGAHLSIGYRRIENEETQLIDAVLGGQFYNTRNLLIQGINPNSRVSTGESLVLLAAKQYNWDIVFLLLEYGADLQGRDKDKRSLLYYAEQEGNIDAVKRLLLLGFH
ncbi:MAG: ankyrin repeat domain-containing protein [Spirochaetaceae bacterium]|jgi:hypothetical protein|nr:ankyrin repeat domain-containing protein [Spirochaetaceae bacterium]